MRLGSPKGGEFAIVVAYSDFEQCGKAFFGPELSPALESVLELGALGLHGAASDREAESGGGGIIHVVFVAIEIIMGIGDGGEGGFVRKRRMGQEFRKGTEQLSGGMVLQGMQELATP